MKIGLYTLTVDYGDGLDTTIHTSEEKAHQHLREWFHAGHPVWEREFTQAELDELIDEDFRSTLVDFDVYPGIAHHDVTL